MPPRRFGLGDALVLVLILAAAGGARAGYLLVWANGGTITGPFQVQGPSPPLEGLPAGTELNGTASPTELDALRHNLRQHRWFGTFPPFGGVEEPATHLAPAYPWLLSLFDRAWPDPAAADRAVRWAQAGLGALTAGLYFLFARRAFRSTAVAVLAGLLAAIHPFWIINTAEIADGVVASFLLAACIWLGARAVGGGAPGASVVLGLALAGLALTRAALLPFAFIALLWFLVRCRRLPQGWLHAVLAILGLVIGLGPWAVRNFQLRRDAVPVVDSAWLHLWMGNNPTATGGPQDETEMTKALAKAEGEDDWRQTARDLADLPGPKERYARLGWALLDPLRADSAAALRRRLWAGLCFLFGEAWLKDPALWQKQAAEPPSAEEPGEEEEAAANGVPGKPAWPVALYAALLAMLLLAGLGWRWSYGWRRESALLGVAVVWVPLPYLLSHGEALVGPRLPLDGVLLCLAAFSLAYLVPGIRRRLRQNGESQAAEPRP